MVIRSFTFDPDLTERFVSFGLELYHDDSNHIPPPPNDIRYMLSDRFPFFRHPDNRHRNFIALSNDRVVGRITAMINHELRDRDGTPVGTVGFFECEPDSAVADRLLNAAIDWLIRENGIQRIWGPMNFDIWHGYRFMTRGYDRKQFFGEPYNKPYYPELFARFGFAVKGRWESVELAGREQITATLGVGSKRYLRLVSGGHRFVPFNKRSFRHDVRTLHQLIGASYSGFLGFTPISLTEFERLFRTAAPALDPELFIFAYNPSGEPVGFAGAFIEISDALRAIKSCGGLLSRIKFVVNRRRTRRLLFYMIGIVPEMSGGGFGLGCALHYSIIHQALERGYETVIAALMSSESRSRSLLGGVTGVGRREYALYELNP